MRDETVSGRSPPNALSVEGRGTEGIDIVSYKRFPGTDLNIGQSLFNTALSKARATVDHAIAHLMTWRLLTNLSGR